MRKFWLKRMLGIAMIAEGLSTLIGLRYALGNKYIPLNLRVARAIARENYRRMVLRDV